MSQATAPAASGTDATPAHLQRIAAWFEAMTPETLTDIGQCYAAQARFKDPFSEVLGHDAIRRVYAHMFETLVQPRFSVNQIMGQNGQGFLVWEMHFQFERFHRGEEQCIRGVSHLKLNAEGLIVNHRDYWDAAEELYEKLPGLGVLMRWLKRRATT
ncbi:nuclear transport factor 2 family protein [Hydrogenophaga sp. 5NK40-0174]|uniref:nuclear transport factor 2 family protein n=1 Tax=Hydrogenophaga sp. 5NK40-0174 TaxID=3127649 RepID=UPI0031072808